MTKKIIFRADGNAENGLGHLYRLFSLVEMLKDNYDFVYITKEDTEHSVVPKNYNLRIIPKSISLSEEAYWLSEIYCPEHHIVIADGYQFTSHYQKDIKSKGYTLIYIDDLVSEYMYADVVINHSPNISASDYKSENYTQFALGTSFAMLRPAFNKAAMQERKIDHIKNAFVCFGGSDALDLSLMVTQALLKQNTIEKVHVVLGGAYKHQEIFTLENSASNLYLHRDLDEVSLQKVMMSCQMAIAPASTILYEICSVKMPVLSGYYVENQKNIYKGLAANGAIFKGDDFRHYTSLDFEHQIQLLLLEKPEFKKCIGNQKKIFDGLSPARIKSIIHRLSITIRKANIDDLNLVFDWSNDKEVRKNAYNSKSIDIEDHKLWFAEKIKDLKTLFLIASVNNQPAGLIRYDIKKTYSIVTLSVSSPFRGKGLAAEFLINSAQIYFNQCGLPVLAYIKTYNKASIKSFRKASYSYLKTDTIQGYSSFIYKLEKKDAEL